MGWLLGRKQRDRELEQEIQAHLAMAARDRMAHGEEPQAAERAARREFGNRALIEETTREMWGWSALETLWQDARYAVRGMRRSPGFTAVAILSLALGIGANTAIFSLVDTILLRRLPVEDPGQLVELMFKAPHQEHFNLFSWKSYDHYRRSNHVFADVIAFGFEPFAVRGEGLEPARLRGFWASETYFPVLGVKAAVGRMFGPEDGAAGSPANVAVVSWEVWKSRFNLDPGIIGRRIVVDDVPATIVGVAPRDFEGMEPGSRPDLWLPFAMEPMVHRSSNIGTDGLWLKLAARLKPGVSLEQARAEMAVLFQWTIEEEIKTSGDGTARNVKSEVEPAGGGFNRLRDKYGRPALALMALVALLLLIACTNVASVLVARGAARRREMALRVALGAGRFRLLRQGLTESLLLSMAAALIGVALAYFGTSVLVRIIAEDPGGVHLQAKPDLAVLLFTAGVAVLTGVVFGLVPAWQASGSAPAASLRRQLFGKGLVVTQVAFSLVLLSAASLFVGHLADLARLDLGMRRDHVLLFVLDPSSGGYDNERLLRAYQDLLGRLEAIPGVRSATECGFYPLSGVGSMQPANVEGYQAAPGERRHLSRSWVAPKYFETFGVPLLMGRDFTFAERGRPRVAIVNQTFVRYFFGNRNPLGKHIAFDGDPNPFEIVGVVGDTRSFEPLPRDPPLRFVYFNMIQLERNYSEFALRTTVDPASLEGEVRRMVRTMLKTVPVTEVRTLEEQVNRAIVPERIVALLSGLFGGLGAALAALGLYGLLAYTVARRTNEIGVRMALGAARGDIMRMVLREAAVMVCGGLAAGVPIVYWSRRFAQSLIPGLSAGGAFPAVSAAAMMLALALAAAYVPARRAIRVDPMEALRYE